MLTVLDSPELTEAFSRPDAFVRPETKEVLDGVLYPWLLSHTRQEVTDAGQAAGWPVTPVHVPAELLTADHLHQRGFWVARRRPRGRARCCCPARPYRLTARAGGSCAAPRRGSGSRRVADGRRRATCRRPPRRRSPLTPGAPPLRGVRVLDLTTVWSGPLADLASRRPRR